MIESASIDYCCFEHKPKEESKVYQTIKAECGAEVADCWTYEVTVKLPKESEAKHE